MDNGVGEAVPIEEAHAMVGAASIGTASPAPLAISKHPPRTTTHLRRHWPLSWDLSDTVRIHLCPE